MSTEKKEDMTLEQKMDYCINNANKLSIDKRRDILNLLCIHGLKEKISESPDGSRIVIQNMTPEHINSIYNFIKNIIES